jgi:hypothetical protein
MCRGRREHREPGDDEDPCAEFSSTQVHGFRVGQQDASVN